MKKIISLLFIPCIVFQLHCKKIISCKADICSSDRETKEIVTNEQGVMGTFRNNNESRWMIAVFGDGPGPKMWCILCGDFPDSLKVMNKPVVFSGALKDACGVVDAEDAKKYFIVTPTNIR